MEIREKTTVTSMIPANDWFSIFDNEDGFTFYRIPAFVWVEEAEEMKSLFIDGSLNEYMTNYIGDVHISNMTDAEIEKSSTKYLAELRQVSRG